MDKEKNLLEKLKNIMKKEETDSPPKNNSFYTWTLVVLMFGVMAMLFSSQTETVLDVSKDVTSTEVGVLKSSKRDEFWESISEYEEAYEHELKDLLQNSVGISELTVMVNLDTSEVNIYEKNINSQIQQTTENDKQGGKREIDQQNRNEQVVITRNGSEEKPLIQKKVKPTVRGVLIVAKGAEKISIKKNIVDAVTRVLDVPSHRVSVLPQK
ncbi:MAG: stage sporulation protein [Bacillales bacterium]|jgi:stage III sporulation protein AG|nr:stage sporulation protein [Bacillales bacterium]